MVDAWAIFETRIFQMQTRIRQMQQTWWIRLTQPIWGILWIHRIQRILCIQRIWRIRRTWRIRRIQRIQRIRRMA